MVIEISATMEDGTTEKLLIGRAPTDVPRALLRALRFAETEWPNAEEWSAELVDATPPARARSVR